MARAIFNSTTPIISAVGHETDVTIADYVADLRAPTPSAAAELAVFDLSQFEEQVKLYSQVLNRSMERKVEKLASDKRRLTDIEKRLSFLIEGSLKAGKHRLALGAGRLEALSPLKKLSAGYGFVTDTRGNAVRTIAQTKPGDIIGISVRDGRIEAQVEHVFESEG